ncbi:hypothetical protein Tco_0091553 [Tanacetum coccineum]
MLCQWRVRKKGYKKPNPYEVIVNWVDDIDSDTFSIVEVTSMLQELGYENPCMAYYYKKPNSELENGLVELVVDKDVYEMLMYVDKFKVIELYTDHTVKKQHVLTQEPLATIIDVTQPDSSSGNEAEVDVSEDEWLRESLKKLPIKSKKGQQSSRKEVGQSSRNGSGSENGSGSDSGSDSEDSDYFVDEENLISDENEVFELEEVDHEEFDSRSDSDEGVRRKALRKVARMNKAIQGKGERVYKEDFFLENIPDFSNMTWEVFKPFTGDQNGPNSNQQYAQLRDYCMELKEKNPNTTVKIEVEPPEDPDSEERKFKRIYICLGPLKDGFKAGGRDFLGLDGCFLSGPYPGQILTAVGVSLQGKCYGNVPQMLSHHSRSLLKNGRNEKSQLRILKNGLSEDSRPQHWAKVGQKAIFCLEEYLMKKKCRIVQKVQDKCDGPLTPSTVAKIFKLISKRAAAKLNGGGGGGWRMFVMKLGVEGIPSHMQLLPYGIHTNYWDRYWNTKSLNCLPVTLVNNMGKEMYKFKINPVNGPQGWKKSDVPTTIIPPKPHPQIGRPPKKRKKSAAELADEMMKSKKLTKTGKSVTCKSLYQVSHSRGSKSKNGGGSHNKLVLLS